MAAIAPRTAKLAIGLVFRGLFDRVLRIPFPPDFAAGTFVRRGICLGIHHLGLAHPLPQRGAEIGQSITIHGEFSPNRVAWTSRNATPSALFAQN
jgi:hypothetical protein